MNAKTTESVPPTVEIVGKVIDNRYRITKRIEGDGVIEHYEAEQLSLGRKVVVKMLLVEKGAQMSERFLREARLLSKLDHPGIVHVIEAGVFERFPFLVRDFVDGRTLAALIHAKEKLTVEEAMPIMIQICDALDHAHQNGVIHRDLTPDKIIIGTDGRPRMIDFGFARMLAPESTNVAPMTNPGILVGTPEYSSPELALGKPVDRRTDLYSIGVIAYKMISGKLPYDGNTHAQVLASMKQKRAEPLSQAAKLPKEAVRFAAVIDRLLESDPIQRCSSASWVAHALRVSTGADAAKLAEANEESTLIGDSPTASEHTDGAPVVIDEKDASTAHRVSDQSLPFALPDFSLPPVDPNDDVTAANAKSPIKKPANLSQPAQVESSPPPAKPASSPHKPVLSEFNIVHSKTAPQRAYDETAKAVRNAFEHAHVKDRMRSVSATFGSQWAHVHPHLMAATSKLDPTIQRLRTQIQAGTDHLNQKWVPRFQGYYARAMAVPVVAKAADRWDVLPRNARLGIGTGIYVVLMVVLFVAASHEPPKPAVLLEEEAAAVVRKPSSDVLAEARDEMKVGEFQKAIDALEPIVVTPEVYGDPPYHAALAHAYAGAGRSVDALQHFGIAVPKDPSALTDGDLASLVSLLSMPKADVEKVITLLKDLGPRAISYLQARADDKALPKDEKKRANDALKALGVAPSPTETAVRKKPRVARATLSSGSRGNRK